MNLWASWRCETVVVLQLTLHEAKAGRSVLQAELPKIQSRIISCFNPIRVASISLCPRLGDHHASARSHAPSAYVTARFATTTLLAERVYLKAQSIPAIISAMMTRSYLGNYNTTSGLHVLDAGHATSVIGSRLVHAATTSTLSASISLILARRLGPSNTNHSPSRNTS